MRISGVVSSQSDRVRTWFAALDFTAQFGHYRSFENCNLTPDSVAHRELTDGNVPLGDLLEQVDGMPTFPSRPPLRTRLRSTRANFHPISSARWAALLARETKWGDDLDHPRAMPASSQSDSSMPLSTGRPYV